MVTIEFRGFKRAFQSILAVMEDLLFDHRFGLETAKVIEVNRLDISEDYKPHCVRYKPTRVRYFRKLMESLPLSKDLMFVDVGCGKGRMLILAAKYGFRRIVGLEMSPILCEIASQNIRHFRTRYPDTAEPMVVCTNALEYEMSDKEQVIFLYRPFDREVTRSFLDLVGESIDRTPREVWLIINELHYPDLLESNRHFVQTDLIIYGASQFFVYHHRVESRA